MWGAYTVLSLSGIQSFRHSNFVSTQYLENELMELDQILYMCNRDKNGEEGSLGVVLWACPGVVVVVARV